MRGDSKRDVDAKWNADSGWGDDSGWNGDSEATGLDLVLVDADGAFQIDSGGIRRTGNEPGQSSNRHYMKTAQSDFVSSDWTCQITFHTPANAPDDIIFIGLGEAVPDSSFYNEPRNSLNFRIHQGTTGFGVGWDVDVMAHDVGYFHWTYSNQGVGSLPSAQGGTFTAQIRKTGSQTTFEILDTAIIVTVPDLRIAAPFLYTSASRIFFGNASGGYFFDDPLVVAGG
jgi:hypothetical protein